MFLAEYSAAEAPGFINTCNIARFVTIINSLIKTNKYFLIDSVLTLIELSLSTLSQISFKIDARVFSFSFRMIHNCLGSHTSKIYKVQTREFAVTLPCDTALLSAELTTALLFLQCEQNRRYILVTHAVILHIWAVDTSLLSQTVGIIYLSIYLWNLYSATSR